VQRGEKGAYLLSKGVTVLVCECRQEAREGFVHIAFDREGHWVAHVIRVEVRAGAGTELVDEGEEVVCRFVLAPRALLSFVRRESYIRLAPAHHEQYILALRQVRPVERPLTKKRE
jgi:hypothetical protein